MPEILLADGRVTGTPKTFRMTITLPWEFKSFIETRVRAAKYATMRGPNKAAYWRDLLTNDRDALCREQRARRNGKRGGK